MLNTQKQNSSISVSVFLIFFINEYLKTVNNPVINGGYYVGYYVSVYEHTPGECVYASE